MRCNVKFGIAWFLASAMLVGCATSANSTETTDETQNLETTLAENENTTKEEKPLYVEYDDSFFTWCDPEKKVYTSFQNVDIDIFARSYNNEYSFAIMTLEHINPEDIEIILPIASDYSITVEEDTKVRTTLYEAFLEANGGDMDGNISILYGENTYPYILYHCYQGTDWDTMLELYLANEEEDESKLEGIMESIMKRDMFSDPKYAELTSVKEVYQLYFNQYRDEYKALTSEDLPLFYYYEVTVEFGTIVEHFIENVENESFESIEIKIGENTYTQEIGEMRIHNETVWEFAYAKMITHNSENITVYGSDGSPTVTAQNGARGDNYPWGDCVVCSEAFTFKTVKELMLTKCFLFAGPAEAELLGMRVVTTDAKGVEMDFYWDLQSPINLEAKTNVYMELFWKDVNLSKLEYSTMLGLALEYEIDGKTEIGSQYIEVNRDKGMNVRGRYSEYSDVEGIGAPWFRYAVVFDGLNLEPYINDFFRPVQETWKEELPW